MPLLEKEAKARQTLAKKLAKVGDNGSGFRQAEGKANTVKLNTIILHSRADETVPFADSEELVRNSRLPLGLLTGVGADRLADEESLGAMTE